MMMRPIAVAAEASDLLSEGSKLPSVDGGIILTIVVRINDVQSAVFAHMNL
jgi:hypothetical protein